MPIASSPALRRPSRMRFDPRMRSPRSQISSLAILLAAVLTIAPNCFAGSSTGGGNSSSSVAPGKTLTGKATYYPDRLNGHETASGDTFHQSDHTAASNKLPLGTTAKVTNLKTGKSTHVTVTDRGPALGSRKIDLTKKAAKDIGLTRKEGVAPVKIKITGTPGGAEATPVP
jgi:rare lipoprotein A